MPDFDGLSSELENIQVEVDAAMQANSAQNRMKQAAFASRIVGVPIPHDHPALGIEARGLRESTVHPIMTHLLQKDLHESRPGDIDDIAAFLEITASMIRGRGDA
jgi:hypothetical protein